MSQDLGAGALFVDGVLGCAHDRGPAPLRETPPPPLASGSPYSPHRELDGPKRQPLASTCVQGGNYLAGEANSLENGSTAQEQMRDKARRAFQQAIGIDPKCVPAYQNLGHLYVDMGDFDHAVATYQTALKIQPRNGSVWFDLGMCQARHKDWSTALDSLRKAVDCEPENRQYINTLGFALARAGRPQESLTWLIRSTGSEAMAQYQLARMLQHLGQTDQARQCLEASLRLDPHMEQAQAMMVQLTAGVRPVGYTEACAGRTGRAAGAGRAARRVPARRDEHAGATAGPPAAVALSGPPRSSRSLAFLECRGSTPLWMFLWIPMWYPEKPPKRCRAAALQELRLIRASPLFPTTLPPRPCPTTPRSPTPNNLAHRRRPLRRLEPRRQQLLSRLQ